MLFKNIISLLITKVLYVNNMTLIMGTSVSIMYDVMYSRCISLEYNCAWEHYIETREYPHT